MMNLERCTVNCRPRVRLEEHSSFITHYSLFRFSPSAFPVFLVRTPTATVADLGTEFGVKVDKSAPARRRLPWQSRDAGDRRRHEERQGREDKNDKVVALGANESARVEVWQGPGRQKWFASRAGQTRLCVKCPSACPSNCSTRA